MSDDPLRPPPANTDTGDCVSPGTVPERLQHLLKNHLGSIWRTAGDLGIAPRDREDIAQEVLVVATRRLDDITPGKERAFLLAVTTKVASNWRRSERRRPADLLGCMDEPLSARCEPWPSPAHPTPDAEQVVVRNEQWAQVQRAMQAMTEAQRVAFVLFDLEQLSAAQIAEQLGVTQSVVFARISRARQALRKLCHSSATPPGTALCEACPSEKAPG